MISLVANLLPDASTVSLALHYNPEGFRTDLTRKTRLPRHSRQSRPSQGLELGLARAGGSIGHRKSDRSLLCELFPTQRFPDAGSGWSTPQRSDRSFPAKR